MKTVKKIVFAWFTITVALQFVGTLVLLHFHEMTAFALSSIVFFLQSLVFARVLQVIKSIEKIFQNAFVRALLKLEKP